LSIDPVTTDANTGGSFNRYNYANNNPYKYIDPDGRNWALAGRGAVLGAEGGFAVCGPWRSAAGAVIVGGAALWAGEKAIDWIASESGGGNGNASSDQSAGGVSKNDGSVGISSSLPKPSTGPGSVPKSERDPKRHFTPGEREAKRESRAINVGTAAGKTSISQTRMAITKSAMLMEGLQPLTTTWKFAKNAIRIYIAENNMSEYVPVLKDENNQSLIPTVWRQTFVEIVEGLKVGDFDLVRHVRGVRPISAEDAARISGNIKRYGARLASLPVEAWQTSTCQWMIGYWDALVDLYSVEEGASDLALAVRVYEDGSDYAFEISSVHVP
jgi:hypothetical protein